MRGERYCLWLRMKSVLGSETREAHSWDLCAHHVFSPAHLAVGHSRGRHPSVHCRSVLSTLAGSSELSGRHTVPKSDCSCFLCLLGHFTGNPTDPLEKQLVLLIGEFFSSPVLHLSLTVTTVCSITLISCQRMTRFYSLLWKSRKH